MPHSAHRIRYLLLAVPALVLAGGLSSDAVAGKPTKSYKRSSAAPQTTKVKRSDVEAAPVRRLEQAELRQLRQTRKLNKGKKLQVLQQAGVQKSKSDVGGATTLSVRKNYISDTTYMSFMGQNAVMPAVEGGLVLLNAEPPSPGLFPSFGPSASSNNYVSVDFEADADKHYLVDCTVFPLGGQPWTEAREDDATINGGLTLDGNHAIQYIPARTRSRKVNVKFMGAMALQSCEITPIG